MANLMEIQSQIEKLQKQAADIKAREFSKTVQEILGKMQAFGITIKDLQLASGKRPPRTKTGKATAGKQVKSRVRGKIAVKYRGPNGEAWSGRGSVPRWLASLIQQGRKKDEFAVKK